MFISSDLKEEIVFGIVLSGRGDFFVLDQRQSLIIVGLLNGEVLSAAKIDSCRKKRVDNSVFAVIE